VHPVPTDGAGGPAPQPRRLPAALIGLVIATLVSVACVLMGYAESSGGGCEGGLCGIAIAIGWGAAFVSWPIVFGLVSLLVVLARRRD
jgi:hypothetical protein